MTFRIERLVPDEWGRWREVRLRALRCDPTAFACSAHSTLGPDAPPERWREALVSRYVFLAVDEHDRDVAMVGLVPEAEPELISMWVAPEVRHLGVGRALVATVVGVAGERDVTLRVMAENARAIAFYRGLGFELEGHTPDVEDTLRMRRVARPATNVWPAPAERPHRPGGRPPAPPADQ